MNIRYLFLFISCAAFAQHEIKTEDFTSKNIFNEKSIAAIHWMKDGSSYSSLSENKIIRHYIDDRSPEVLLNGNELSPSLRIDNYFFNGDETKILLQTATERIYRRSFKAIYYLYDVTNKTLKLLSERGLQSYATFSPDGNKVSFVRDNNLFVVDLNGLKEKPVTTDGKMNHIINGTTDWVYEEELGFVTAFFWSPDSEKIAYYRFDESGVKEYTLQKWSDGNLYPENYVYKYPKAGEDNSLVSIHIYDLSTQEKIEVDLGAEKDIYIPRVEWTTDPEVLSVRRMNRLQNRLEVLHADVSTGNTNVVVTEESDTYVNYTNYLYYTRDGKHFILASERSGFKHLYLYTIEGKLVNQITSGEWEALNVSGIDENKKTIYYISTEPGYLERHLYSISFSGKKKQRLTEKPGVHVVTMSSDFKHYIDRHSNSSQPLVVSLNEVNGTTLKLLETNEALRTRIEEYNLVPKEFFKYRSGDDVTMLDGYMLKPATIEAGKKYSVLVYQYSGPNSPSVLNDFGGSYYYWFQMLVQKGYIVAVLDTRGTSYRGAEFVKQTYRQLGKLELEDLLAGGKFLKSLSYVDDDRLGIFGWSYGGYMTSLVMTKGAGVYSLGIAGAPVTSWRYYDNIYTERYLQRPQDNPSGYDENSPINYAKQLEGDFLLIHGTGDDNVHVQNSLIFQEALINASKQFQMFYYPNEAHGIPRSPKREHLFNLMTAFILENL